MLMMVSLTRETLQSVTAQLELLERLRGLVVDRPVAVRMPSRAAKGRAR